MVDFLIIIIKIDDVKKISEERINKLDLGGYHDTSG